MPRRESRPLSRPASRLSLQNTTPAIEIGDQVSVIASGARGIVRFSGPTDFAGGHWVGVELNEPLGKNNGSVDDICYFDCKVDCGLFVRSGQLQMLDSHPKSIRPGLRSRFSRDQLDEGVRTKTIPLELPTKTIPMSPRLTRSRAKAATKADAVPIKLSTLESKLKKPNEKSRSPSANTESSITSVGSKFGESCLQKIPKSSKLGSPILSPKAKADKIAKKTLKDIESMTYSSSSSLVETPNNAESIKTSIPKKSLAVYRSVESPLKIDLALGYSGFRPSHPIRTDSIITEISTIDRYSEPHLHDEGRPSALDRMESEDQFIPASTASTIPNTSRVQTILNEKIEQLRQKCDLLQHDKERLSNELISSKASYQREKTETLMKQDELALRNAEKVEMLKSETGRLRQKCDILAHEKNSLTQELASTRAELESERQKFSHSLEDKKQVEAIQASYKSLLSKYEACKSDMKNSHSHQEKLLSELKLVKQELKKLSDELDGSKQSIDKSNLEKVILNNQLDEALEDIKRLKAELETPLPVARTDLQNPIRSHNTNERLAEALLRLKELSLEREAELEERLKLQELDIEQLKEFDVLRNDFQQKLAVANNRIETLTAQLVASTDKDILVAQLTDKNLKLGKDLSQKEVQEHELEQVRKVNEDLVEAYKDLEQHLHSELELKSNVIQELVERYSMQQKRLADTESQLNRTLEKKTSNAEKESKEVQLLKQSTILLENQLRQFKRALVVAQDDFSTKSYESSLLYEFIEKFAEKKSINGLMIHISNRCKLLLQAHPELIQFSICKLSSACAAIAIISQYDLTAVKDCEIGIFRSVEKILESQLRDDQSESISFNPETLFVEFLKLFGHVEENLYKLSESNPSIAMVIMAEFHSCLFASKCLLEKTSKFKALAQEMVKLSAAASNLNREFESHPSQMIPRESCFSLMRLRPQILELNDQLNHLFADDDSNLKKTIANTFCTVQLLYSGFKSLHDNISFVDCDETGIKSWLQEATVWESRMANHESLIIKFEDMKLQSYKDRLNYEELNDASSLQVAILNNKLSGLTQKVIELKAELERAEKVKNQYMEALEAVHADLKDAEAELVDMRTVKESANSRAIQFSTFPDGSPRKPKEITKDRNMYENDKQLATIELLLQENMRLKAIEYAKVAYELFHPSDPVMKRASQLQDSSKAKASKTKTLIDQAQSVSRNLISKLSSLKVVDLTRKANHLLGKRREDNRITRQLLHASSKIEAELEDYTTVHSKFATGPAEEIGEIQFPAVITRKSNVDLKSWIQMKYIHSLLL